jgi:hypothetical protein
MPASNGNTKQSPMGYSVGHFTFTGLRFIIMSFVTLIAAMTIGSFSFVAERGDSLARILISGQSITILALVAWAWFVRTGIKNSLLQEKLWLIDTCLIAFIVVQVGRLLTTILAG